MKHMLTNIQEIFYGKKTYLVGILMVVLGFLQGDNQMILEGLGFITIRQGIAKL